MSTTFHFGRVFDVQAVTVYCGAAESPGVTGTARLRAGVHESTGLTLDELRAFRDAVDLAIALMTPETGTPR